MEGATASGVHRQMSVCVSDCEYTSLFVRVSRTRGPSHTDSCKAHRSGGQCGGGALLLKGGGLGQGGEGAPSVRRVRRGLEKGSRSRGAAGRKVLPGRWPRPLLAVPLVRERSPGPGVGTETSPKPGVGLPAGRGAGKPAGAGEGPAPRTLHRGLRATAAGVARGPAGRPGLPQPQLFVCVCLAA